MFQLIAFVLVLASATQATVFTTCKVGPAPLALRVEGCEQEPCDFHRGENVVAELDFLTGQSIQTLSAAVKATVLGATVNFPLPEPNACLSLIESNCPLEDGEICTYKLVLPILKAYPKVPLTMELSLVDQTKDVTVCFHLSGKVV